MTLEEARDYWSFKPLAKPAAPKVRDAKWAKDDLDRFVQAQREAKGLHAVADADRRTLLRRLYFDLIGLPPSPAEIDAFVSASSAKPQAAVEEVVDHLLQSPHFGERWGCHWLDLARFAESNGNADNTPFPHAWRYRDWVIKAVNQDKPYDQFLREQVAGDLLPSKDASEKDDLLTATAFLALTSKPRAQNNPDYRMDLIADQIDVTTRAGEKPTHPELLDHLASRFLAEGWSTKKLIRAIVLSRTYQLASAHDTANMQAEPDNLLLWRMSPRRLEAEAIRDASLTVSGRLNRTPPAGSLSTVGPGKKPAPVSREAPNRSVYLAYVRDYSLTDIHGRVAHEIMA